MSGAYRGYLCPTFEAVQMYYTRNGLPWEDDPETKDIDPLAYNKAAGTVEMHLHKEPRFYASVGYDRGTYRFNGGKMTIKAHKGEPQGFTGSYDNEYQSYNGYFCQKWVNEQSKMTLNSSGNYSVSTYMSYVFPYMRIAELYLSYAEADFEYDGTLSDYGYECLNKYRSARAAAFRRSRIRGAGPAASPRARSCATSSAANVRLNSCWKDAVSTTSAAGRSPKSACAPSRRPGTSRAETRPRSSTSWST